MRNRSAAIEKTRATRSCPTCGKTMTTVIGAFGMHVARCGRDEIALFWSRVDKNGPGGCWLWTSYRNEKGYGLMQYKQRKNIRAHRFSWELVHGPTPSDKFCLHKCDVRNCVNPDHLFLGSYQENSDDMKSKGRWNGGTRVLSREQVLEIRANPPKMQQGKRGGTEFQAYAKRYGIGPNAIWAALTRRTWKNI